MQVTRSTVVPTQPQGGGDDVQSRPPRVPIGLSRVGVTGVEKVVRIRDELYFARLETGSAHASVRFVLLR